MLNHEVLGLGFILLNIYRRYQIEHYWLHPNEVFGLGSNLFVYRYRRYQVEHYWLHLNLDIGTRVGSQIQDHIESGMTKLDVQKLSAS